MVTAARLIAPLLDPADPGAGFEWCMAQVSNTPMHEVLHQLGLAKAMVHMSKRDIASAVRVLRDYEARGDGLRGAAAANLAFLAVHEGKLEQADEHADTAVACDP